MVWRLVKQRRAQTHLICAKFSHRVSIHQRQPGWGRRDESVGKKERLVARHKVGPFMVWMEAVASRMYHLFCKKKTRGSACTCRYWRSSFERHRPNSLVMLISTPDQRRAMVPSARINCTDTCLGVNHRLGPRNWTAYFSILLMSISVMFTQPPRPSWR